MPFINVSIFLGELMPVNAMSLACLRSSKPHASEIIFASSDHFQMLWVHAMAHAAKVVDH